MKQKYVKPSILVERFTLTQSIASGCGAPAGGSTLGEPDHWSKTTCGWKIGEEIVLFLTGASFCPRGVDEDGDFEGVCYNNPDGGTVIFSSF